MSTKTVDVEALHGHTPGPWFVCAEPKNDRWFSGLTVGSSVLNCRVADSCVFNHHHDTDARLIAAAPDLLAEVIALRAELAAKDAAVAELVEASGKLYNAMSMQEMREEGVLHIPQPSAKKIWDEAKASYESALANFRGAK